MKDIVKFFLELSCPVLSHSFSIPLINVYMHCYHAGFFTFSEICVAKSNIERPWGPNDHEAFLDLLPPHLHP